MLQTISRTVEQAVMALQAMSRAGSAGSTPGLQQLGSPAMTWDADVDGYPVSSPSIPSATKWGGLRKSGGYGSGSYGASDPVYFVEPNKRQPGI